MHFRSVVIGLGSMVAVYLGYLGIQNWERIPWPTLPDQIALPWQETEPQSLSLALEAAVEELNVLTRQAADLSGRLEVVEKRPAAESASTDFGRVTQDLQAVRVSVERLSAELKEKASQQDERLADLDGRMDRQGELVSRLQSTPTVQRGGDVKLLSQQELHDLRQQLTDLAARLDGESSRLKSELSTLSDRVEALASDLDESKTVGERKSIEVPPQSVRTNESVRRQGDSADALAEAPDQTTRLNAQQPRGEAVCEDIKGEFTLCVSSVGSRTSDLEQFTCNGDDGSAEFMVRSLHESACKMWSADPASDAIGQWIEFRSDNRISATTVSFNYDPIVGGGEAAWKVLRSAVNQHHTIKTAKVIIDGQLLGRYYFDDPRGQVGHPDVYEAITFSETLQFNSLRIEVEDVYRGTSEDARLILSTIFFFALSGTSNN